MKQEENNNVPLSSLSSSSYVSSSQHSSSNQPSSYSQPTSSLGTSVNVKNENVSGLPVVKTEAMNNNNINPYQS